MEAIEEKMPDAMAADPNIPEETAKTIREVTVTAMKVGKIVMLVFLIGWFTTKAIFYLFCVSYLSRTNIKAFFESPVQADIVVPGNR